MNITNPFHLQDPDRAKIWKILVQDDIDAFIKNDWKLWGKHFDSKTFRGMHAHHSSNPDTWTLEFPNLTSFERIWKSQAAEFSNASFQESPALQLHRVTTLRDIEINGKCAIARKKFDGVLFFKEGKELPLRWQSHYYLQKQGPSWKITGVLGYLPNPMGEATASVNSQPSGKVLPEIAKNHKMAGPYSPVLEVSGSKLIVISGQAAISMESKVIGTTMEEQARYTIENCRQQLEFAGCTLHDVFKVNAFVTDLKLWPRFNAIYQELMPKPYPVRTTVQTGLLPDLLVEIEMWAIKK